MTNLQATKEEWQQLFEVTNQFKKQAPWNWMEDDDYFLITDPESSELGCCVVFGAGKFSYGLNVYTGPNGRLFLQELSGVTDYLSDDRLELARSMCAVTVSFENRDRMHKDDLQIIRDLGYKFRGAHAWPQFRSFEPGFLPALPNGREVRFLIAALEQTMLVADRFRENHELYFEHDQTDEGTGEKRLHRIPKATNSGVTWSDTWLPWLEEGEFLTPYVYPNELQLRQLGKSLKTSTEIWHSDFQYISHAFGEKGERGSYPRLSLWMSASTGLILTSELSDNPDFAQNFVEQLLNLIKTSGYKPKSIYVRSNKAFFALNESADKLGITVKLNFNLPELHMAFDEIEDSL
ncbi:hypothetical protein GCM10008018_59660 [Paenibacillus marchantiophytorum]|uniref:GNAT family N-acetyltransferase n=1 Tax=Paenibacillus marchantiophytorum TaxID=1619310 RepID=A0ABQ1FCB1_9BACL|nr:hypothetical protein [Paenibacillus marchantiophytorum]GGA05796.1 hypothetical protein GCM10008018_59660 [Paenibacillus marchantiophytorum]